MKLSSLILKRRDCPESAYRVATPMDVDVLIGASSVPPVLCHRLNKHRVGLADRALHAAVEERIVAKIHHLGALLLVKLEVLLLDSPPHLVVFLVARGRPARLLDEMVADGAKGLRLSGNLVAACSGVHRTLHRLGEVV